VRQSGTSAKLNKTKPCHHVDTQMTSNAVGAPSSLVVERIDDKWRARAGWDVLGYFATSAEAIHQLVLLKAARELGTPHQLLPPLRPRKRQRSRAMPQVVGRARSSAPETCRHDRTLWNACRAHLSDAERVAPCGAVGQQPDELTDARRLGALFRSAGVPGPQLPARASVVRMLPASALAQHAGCGLLAAGPVWCGSSGPLGIRLPPAWVGPLCSLTSGAQEEHRLPASHATEVHVAAPGGVAGGSDGAAAAAVWSGGLETRCMALAQAQQRTPQHIIASSIAA
jgi:hypothetical protein